MGGTGYTYDANGNLTSDGTNTYVYDDENRLVSKTGNGTTTTLRYDPLGRLYEMVDSVTGTTRFLYDGDSMVAEYNGAGTMLDRYAWGAGPDELLLWVKGATLDCSGARVVQPNQQGSIIATADCSGNLLSINTYDEYGVPGGAEAGRFLYTGQAWFPELGLYYYKARMYSPTLGRFMQTDPVGYTDQIDLYAYVGNDPVNGVDPTGNECTGSNITNSAGECAGGGHIAAAASGHCYGACGTSMATPAAHLQSLTNVVYNESGSLRTNPRVKPGAKGSAQDLANGRQAIAEIANRVINAGHPNRVAPSTLGNRAALAVKTYGPAIKAYAESGVAAAAALGGSNISNGATQYRTRIGTDVTTPVGRSRTNPGTPVSQYYGPFVEGKHEVVIVIAQ